MKTIEQKAKAYDEVYKKVAVRFGSNVADEIFLKESEDERIRKALKEYFVNSFQNNGVAAICGVHIKDILAWLEKQGEHNMGISEATKQELDDNLNKALEKETQESMNKFLDEQNKQKPVEPKFMIGDLITNGIIIGKIDEIHELGYHAYFGDHYADVPDIENWHKWTLKDAKDGDILCTYECDKPKIVFILKGTPKKHYALSYYCFYNIMYPCFKSDYEKGCLAPNDEDIKPATKGQRDTLMKAMADAGYTFDFEKKMLKNIVTPIFHVGDRVRYKGHSCDGVITEITNTDYICGNAKLPISTQDKLELVEQNPTWSKEDEKNSLEIRCLIGNYRTGDDEYRLDSWVDHLKERVQPQPKQEWSEEDIKVIKEIIFLLKHYNSNENLTTVHSIKDMINWLKSLRPQSHWKPSNEQIETLKYACGGNYVNLGILGSLYQDLKKLKEE